MKDLIPVETSIFWRWRCLTEEKVISGDELQVHESPATEQLVDYRALKVPREKLRCPCGGYVLPIAPGKSDLRR
jgi:hypothetical protein